MWKEGTLMNISDFLKLIKLPLIFLIAILLILSFLLFAPDSYITSLGINDIIDKYRTYIGLAFVCDIFFILVEIISLLIKSLRDYKNYYSIIFKGKRKLKELTDDEKSILAYYIDNKTRTQELPFNNGIVEELSSFKIIYRASTMSLGGTYFSYNINDWAWNYLNKHKELLK